MRRLALALALLVATTAAAADPETRAFRLRHRPVAEAVALVVPLLSPAGSVVLQPQDNTLVVRDGAEVLASVEERLRRWDVAPAAFTVEIRLIHASNVQPTPRPGPHFAPDVRELAAATPTPSGPHFRTLEDELRRLFRYRYFSDVGVVRVATTEGATVELPGPGPYAVRFTLRALPPTYSRIQLAGFALLRRGGDGPPARRAVFEGNVNLGVRQLSVVGAAPAENADEALVLAFRVEREKPE